MLFTFIVNWVNCRYTRENARPPRRVGHKCLSFIQLANRTRTPNGYTFHDINSFSIKCFIHSEVF